jgi:hypothetical protein
MKEILTSNGTKPKSIIIDGELHNEFKTLCKNKCLKIGGVIEGLIRLYLRNPKKIEVMIEELKDIPPHY